MENERKRAPDPKNTCGKYDPGISAKDAFSLAAAGWFSGQKKEADFMMMLGAASRDMSSKQAPSPASASGTVPECQVPSPK